MQRIDMLDLLDARIAATANAEPRINDIHDVNTRRKAEGYTPSPTA